MYSVCTFDLCYCISTLQECEITERQSVLIDPELVYVDDTDFFVLIVFLVALCVFQILQD